MSALLEIDLRLKRIPFEFTMRATAAFTDEQLRTVMRICNSHLGDPTQDLGGPRLPPLER